jgi:hypothetical protein
MHNWSWLDRRSHAVKPAEVEKKDADHSEAHHRAPDETTAWRRVRLTHSLPRISLHFQLLLGIEPC